jgi:hypothetical protein
MILWALVFGMSVTLASSGKLTSGAQVEGTFPTEAECKVIKEKLDTGSKAAVDRGEVPNEINSFGAVCIPVKLDIHNKKFLLVL